MLVFQINCERCGYHVKLMRESIISVVLVMLAMVSTGILIFHYFDINSHDFMYILSFWAFIMSFEILFPLSIYIALSYLITRSKVLSGYVNNRIRNLVENP